MRNLVILELGFPSSGKLELGEAGTYFKPGEAGTYFELREAGKYFELGPGANFHAKESSFIT